MGTPTTVNPMITDAVTQANIKVLGEAPAMAMGAIYQTLAHSTGILFENAVANQQQQATLAQAAANQGVMQIYSLDTISADQPGSRAPTASKSGAVTAARSAETAAARGGKKK